MTVFRTRSEISGEIHVRDCGRERLLLINDEAHSLYFTRGGWGEVRREYWGSLARPAFGYPVHPSVLMLGLGGGSALRLMRETLRPGAVTVVELDPVIISTAREYFALDYFDGLSVIEGDAMEFMARAKAGGSLFDVLVDDVYFTVTSLKSPPGTEILSTMLSLVRPGGTLILNRPVDDPGSVPLHRRLAEELREEGCRVILQSVRGRWWNDVLHCQTPGGRG